jgi:hypothetical protein
MTINNSSGILRVSALQQFLTGWGGRGIKAAVCTPFRSAFEVVNFSEMNLLTRSNSVAAIFRSFITDVILLSMRTR